MFFKKITGIIQLIINSCNANFALDTTDDDDEFIQPIVDLGKALKKFKKLDNVCTYDRVDIDDSIGLCRVWSLMLTFVN